MYFLSIPFTFSAANIRPNDMTAGMPAMSAVAGMAHNVERTAKDMGIATFESLAFSLIYFNMDRDDGPPRRPAQEPAGGSMVLPSLMDIRRAHGQAALVIYFNTDSHEDHTRMIEAANSGDLEHSLMSELRFAGGEVFIGTDGEFGNTTLDLGIYSEWKSVLKAVMRTYPTQGLLIQDMSHLITEWSTKTGCGALHSMTDLLYQSRVQRNNRPPRGSVVQSSLPLAVEEGVSDQAVPVVFEENNRSLIDDLLSDDLESIDLSAYESEDAADLDVDVHEPLGTLLPNAVGFHGICAPRGGQHFVEPVLSLVRPRVLPSVMLDLNPEMQERYGWRSHFWAWQHLPEHQLYRAVSFATKATSLELTDV